MEFLFPEQTFFYGFAVCGILYLGFRKRTLDFATLGFVALLVYNFPLFLGWTAVSTFGYRSEIHPMTYMVVGIVGTILLLVTMVFDAIPKDKFKGASRLQSHLSASWVLLFLVAVFFICLTVAVTRNAILWSNDKALILSMLPSYALLYQPAIMLAYYCFFRNRSWLAVGATLCLALLDTYFGFRLTVAGIFIITFILGFQFKPIRLSREWRLCLGALSALVFLFVYKQLYQNIKLGQFDIIADRYEKGLIFGKAITESEPNVITSSLNEIVQYDLNLPTYYLPHLIPSVIPLGRSLTGYNHPGFNFYFQELLFPKVRAGMAGTFFGEVYAISGFGLVVAAALLWAILIHSATQLIRRSSREFLAAPLFVFLLYMSFYIFRNDISFQISLTRDLAFVTVIGLAMFKVLTREKIL